MSGPLGAVWRHRSPFGTLTQLRSPGCVSNPQAPPPIGTFVALSISLSGDLLLSRSELTETGWPEYVATSWPPTLQV